MSQIDLLVKNGRIIDPTNGVDTVADIAVNDGIILSIDNNIQFQAKETFDAGGCLVTPGLIDCHVHCYQYSTPLGINPDEHCLSRGVTTIVDGGSAGTGQISSSLGLCERTFYSVLISLNIFFIAKSVSFITTIKNRIRFRPIFTCMFNSIYRFEFILVLTGLHVSDSWISTLD